MSNYRLLMLYALIAGTCSMKAMMNGIPDFSPKREQELTVDDLPDCDDLTVQETNQNKPCKAKTATEKLILALKATGSSLAGVTLGCICGALVSMKDAPLGGGFMEAGTSVSKVINDIPFFLVKCSMAYVSYEFVGAGLKAIRELRES